MSVYLCAYTTVDLVMFVSGNFHYYVKCIYVILERERESDGVSTCTCKRERRGREDGFYSLLIFVIFLDDINFYSVDCTRTCTCKII